MNKFNYSKENNTDNSIKSFGLKASFFNHPEKGHLTGTPIPYKKQLNLTINLMKSKYVLLINYCKR